MGRRKLSKFECDVLDAYSRMGMHRVARYLRCTFSEAQEVVIKYGILRKRWQHATRKPYYLSGSGYKMVVVGRGKMRFEHRVVMEEALGRKLDRKEVVHHINGDKLDNRLENLELIESSGVHLLTRHEIKINVDTDRMLKLYDTPMTTTNVAKEMGLSYGVVRSRLVEMGRLRKWLYHEMKIKADMKQIMKMWDASMTLVQISKRTGIKRATVWYKIKAYERDEKRKSKRLTDCSGSDKMENHHG